MSGDNPRLIQARRGFSVFYRGKSLLSNIDPITQAERSVDNLSIKDRTLYLCPSPLLGYGLKRLLDLMAKNAPNSALLCIESDEQLLKLSQDNFDAELSGDKRLRLTGITEKAALCAFVRRTWGKRYFRRVEPVRLGGGWRLFQELYDSLEDTLRREIALDWGNALTLTKLGRLYIRNALRNLSLLPRYPSLANLSFGGDPVLVLGAGPSLDTLLDGLFRRFGGRLEKTARPFKIVCADTCLEALRARNIRPDLVVILESQHWNLRDFIGLGDWSIPAAVDLSALPASAALPGIQARLFFTPWTSLRIFGRMEQAGLLPETFPPLGSVGLSAVAVALRLTSGPVLTGGLDFSFTADSYHARSTPGHLDKLRRHNRFRDLFNAAAFAPGAREAVSKSGAAARSNPAMRNYRKLFEQEFAGEGRLFDIVSGGLPLGIPALREKEFFDILESGGNQNAAAQTERSANAGETKTAVSGETLATFIEAEKKRLTTLRDILSGKSQAEAAGLEILVDECDYLWAHFPDYAEAGERRPAAGDFSAGTPQAISFLKRIQAEAGSMLAIFELLAEK